MKISTKGRYALRLMMDLARCGDEGPVSLRDVSRRQGISDKYLEQIVTPLARTGLVRSVRGAGGGYLLTRKPEEYTVGEILRPLEGDLAPVECGTDPAFCQRSWGMSHDYPLALRQGATLVRIGTAIFGEREH